MSLVNRFRIKSSAFRWAAAAALLTTAFTPAVHAAALRVVQDPVSGELRGPTAAEADAFAKAEAALRASNRVNTPLRSTGPKEIRYADGTVETKLDEDSMLFAVVNEQADGSLRMDCVPAQEARKAVKATSARKTSTHQVANIANAKAGHDHQ